jgi:hypothetical protein
VRPRNVGPLPLAGFCTHTRHNTHAHVTCPRRTSERCQFLRRSPIGLGRSRKAELQQNAPLLKTDLGLLHFCNIPPEERVLPVRAAVPIKRRDSEQHAEVRTQQPSTFAHSFDISHLRERNTDAIVFHSIWALRSAAIENISVLNWSITSNKQQWHKCYSTDLNKHTPSIRCLLSM